MKSLYDSLNPSPTNSPEQSTPLDSLVALTGPQFAEAILSSPEFRRFIIVGLTLGTLPSAVICRLMDYGWGKPVEHVELSGEVRVARVERVIIDAPTKEADRVH